LRLESLVISRAELLDGAFFEDVILYRGRTDQQLFQELSYLIGKEQKSGFLAERGARWVNLVLEQHAPAFHLKQKPIRGIALVEDCNLALWQRFRLATISEILVNLGHLALTSNHHCDSVGTENLEIIGIKGLQGVTDSLIPVLPVSDCKCRTVWNDEIAWLYLGRVVRCVEADPLAQIERQWWEYVF